LSGGTQSRKIRTSHGVARTQRARRIGNDEEREERGRKKADNDNDNDYEHDKKASHKVAEAQRTRMKRLLRRAKPSVVLHFKLG
jgi:hypothetical protein